MATNSTAADECLATLAGAASGLLRDIFGEVMVSSRLVLGVASLPLGSPVELEVILEVRPG